MMTLVGYALKARGNFGLWVWAEGGSYKGLGQVPTVFATKAAAERVKATYLAIDDGKPHRTLKAVPLWAETRQMT